MTGDNPVGAMVTGLAWAVPVKPVKLIAHLEAYVQHKQAIRSLGLCVRFGRGPQAYVTKISFEIRSMIEAQIIAETVNEMEALWSERMGCFELECGPFSHLTPEEKARRYPAYQESNRNGNNSLRFPHPHRDEYDRHNDRAEAWSALFSRHTPAKPNSFRYRFDNVMAKDFGLEVYMAIHRNDDDSRPRTMYSGSVRTSVCMLILPATFMRTAVDLQEVGGPSTERFAIGETFASNILDPVDLIKFASMSEMQLRRFVRAMRIIGLKPNCIDRRTATKVPLVAPTSRLHHRTPGRFQAQIETSEHAVAISGNEKNTKNSISKWPPKLMMLTHSDFCMQR